MSTTDTIAELDRETNSSNSNSKSNKGIYFVDNQKAKQFTELGLPLEPTELDLQLTELMREADHSTLIVKYSYLLRVKDNKGEWSYGYFSITGKDSSGNQLRLVTDIPFGITEELDSDQIERNNKGEIIYINPNAHCHRVYTIPFSSKEVERLLSETQTDTSKLQLALVTSNNRRLAGFSLEEFLSLPFAELVMRNKFDMCGYPTDFLLSSMTGKDMIALQQLKNTGGKK